MRWAFFPLIAAGAIGCGTSNDQGAPADASTASDAPTLDAPASDAPAIDAADASPTYGITGATVYAGTTATIAVTSGGGAQPHVSWSLVSAPTGSAITSASIAMVDFATASFVPDVVGDYVIAANPNPDDTLNATVHALAAPVYFVRTTINAGGGILDVHVAGHDGSGSHGVACTTTFDGTEIDSARLRTMLTGAGGMDWWEAPPGQASRFAFAGVASLRADADGGYAVSLVAGTDQSSCGSVPQTLRSLEGPVGALGQPRFSPDGTRVAFLEPIGSSFQLSTVGFDGSGYRAVAPIYPGGAPPSGAGDESSFVRAEWAGATKLVWARANAGGTWSAVTADDAAGAAPQVLVTCPGSSPHHVAPLGGAAIVAAYSPSAGAPVDLFAIDTSNATCGAKVNLTHLAGPNSRAHDFAVSPDAKSIAFLRYDASNDAGPDPNNEGDLFLVPSDGSAPAAPVGAPTTGRIGPRFVGAGSRLAWTRVAPPAPGPDGGDPKYAEAVTVVLLDGGAPADLAVGNGADAIVAGVGPGGSCAIARGARSPAALYGLAIALALLVSRRRR